MTIVQRFDGDNWSPIEATSLRESDIFIANGNTYIAKGPASVDTESGKLTISADPYSEGPIIIDLGGNPETEYIMMVSDFVGSGVTNFNDGTMMICDMNCKHGYVYSPRLAIKDLNEFCKKHKETYSKFYDKHRDEIDDGKAIHLESFW
ncbi:TPA: hypothetical protein I7730_00255 [Vibrio vulnificus]|uniref:Uncharacterized protein n=1 Tax=Vibrio vulnificus TaxID=672 RepID=A0A8H9MZ37_VIBVL|nr:hypothetical protein [Vibrio vulnificus]HAS8538230.1 hypothetical protein [Vibrio vulnificus]